MENNQDSGIAYLESSGGVVFNNTVNKNVHGIRFSVGSRDNVVAGNTFEDNTGYDVYLYMGNDAVVEAESGSPTNNIFFGNTFSGNTGGARFDDSVDTQFVSNSVRAWADFELKNSDNGLILGNTFPADMGYISSGSCLNSASDVVFGDVCSHAPITNPFGQSDFERIIGGKDRMPETATTETPPDSQMNLSFPTASSSSISGSSGSVSPSVSSFSAAPTVLSGLFVHTMTPTAVSRNVLIIPPSESSSSGSSSGGGGGTVGGTGDGSGGDDDDFLFVSSTGPTASPTPTEEESNGAHTAVAAPMIAGWVGFVGVILAVTNLGQSCDSLDGWWWSSL